MPGPVQPVDYVPGPNGEPIPHYNNATPGVGGAIQDLIRVLAQAFAPRGITQAGPRREQAISQAVGGGGQSNSPQTTDLGNQF